MKSTVAFLCLFACYGILQANQTSPGFPATRPSPLLEELVQMTRAGSSDAEVLAYARAHRGELPAEVKAADLIWLHDAGVSERVVSYMSAVDVRIPDDALQENPAPEVPGQDAPPPGSAYSYPESQGGPYANGYANGDVTYSNDYASPDSYADSYYGSYWGDWCPYYGYGYYPYAFYIYQPPFCNRFHDHVHHHDNHNDHHGHDGDHGTRNPQSVATARGTTTEAWRSRGVTASARRPATVGPRGSSRTMVARQGAVRNPGVASRTLAPRGFGSSGAAARHGFSGGFRAPQASIASRGSISRPSFSGGGTRSFSGGGMRGGGGSAGGARGRH
jgi:hypothetical protein